MKKRQKKSTPKQSFDFKVGDLVGAKVKGHPVWPGIIDAVEIVANNRKKYNVRFFGTNDTSKNIIELKPFKDFTDKERSCGKKGFAEALALCQERYNSIKHDDKEVGDDENANNDRPPTERGENQKSIPPSAPLVTSTTSLNQDEPMDTLSSGLKEEVSAHEHNCEITSLPPSTSPEHTNNDVEEPSNKWSLNDLKKEPVAQVNLLNPEEENVMQSSNRETTLAKLQEKLKLKMEIKEACKRKKMRKRLEEKASKKFPIIEANLLELSGVFKKLSKTNANQADTTKWNVTVRKYNSFLPVLETYIRKYFMTEYSKEFEESEERKQCYKILQQIVADLRKTKKNKVLPAKMNDEVKKMLKNMRNHQILRDFICEPINIENSKNAMTERKENDTV